MSSRAPLDDSTRPVMPKPGPLSDAKAQRGQHLVQVHDMYRRELRQVRAAIAQVGTGHAAPEQLRRLVNDMTMRRTYRQLGSFCASFCQLVETHHGIESAAMFPALRRAQGSLAPVLDRLELEHKAIHRLLVELDTDIAAMAHEPTHFPVVQERFENLATVLLSHFRYEESQLVDPIGRHELMI